MGNAQVSLEFMLCATLFVLLLLIISNAAIELSSRLERHNTKAIAVSKAQRCALIADSLASNPGIKTLTKIECPIFEGKAAGDFNSGFVYAETFASVEIVGKHKEMELVVHGSHYR